MNFRLQKALAAKVAKVGKQRVKIDASETEDVKGAITKADVRDLIVNEVIIISKKKGVSRYRARKRHEQKKKGRQKGPGARKGTATARSPKKRTWINKIRIQRKTLKELRDSGRMEVSVYRKLYLKSKGGFFRSKKHLLLFIEQNKLLKSKTK